MKISSGGLQLLLIGLLIFIPLTRAQAGFPPTQPDGIQSTTDTTADTWIYLPLLNTTDEQSSSPAPQTRRVNVPFVDPTISDDPDRDSAIFWFGKVTPDENYTDVRVRYERERIVLTVEIFDRLLWQNRSADPNKAEFHLWDSVSLLLSRDPNPGSAPTANSYRVDAMVNNSSSNPNYQAAYRGNGVSWALFDLGLPATIGWRGDAINTAVEDRGWMVRFSIPYSRLGISTAPDEGTLWRLGIIVNDRDDRDGRAIPAGRWPENAEADNPQTWGELNFGIFRLPAPASPTSGTVTIRQGLNNAVVTDAAVGGTVDNLCPGDPYFIWNVWGNLNFAGAEGINIQNQADVADWPCFAKYYLTFPLDQIPPGKVIQSAALVLHHWGNNGPSNLAKDSVIHVLSIDEGWSEGSITWNNAPMALENIDLIRVPKVDCTYGTGRYVWPCPPRTWDVGRAADQAYQNNLPLRLALYSSDTARHSGKLFSTSDVEAWNETGRPTLVITYGDR